jgi:hypothetical protein
MDLYQITQAMTAQGTLTPEVYKKVKKPFADTLYTLGVKDCDIYLPSDEEVAQMIQKGMMAAKNKQPTPQEQKDTSAAELNQARTQQIMATIEGVDADSQLNYMSMAMAERPGRPQDYGH